MHIGVCRRACTTRRLALSLLVGASAIVVGCGRRTTTPEPASLAVRLVGHDHRWRFEYAGPDGVPGTSDDRASSGDLHVPAGVPIHLELHSEDELYFFGVPALDAKQIAMPELTYRLEIEAHPEGRFDLLGDQMCGAAFPGMRGQLVIEPWPAFMDWLERQPQRDYVAGVP